MRIYEIKFLGRQRADGVPKSLVRVTRAFGVDAVTIYIIDPKGVREDDFPINSPKDIRIAAEYLQHELDGFKGTDSEIQEYCHLLEHLENL
jgi:hypothetical protein